MDRDNTGGISAVTAAAASARFPWISPAGTIGPWKRPDNGSESFALLDGGVFEATGAEVVDELLRGLSSWCDQSGTPGVLRCTPGHGRPDAEGHPGPIGLCVAEQEARGNCMADGAPIFVRPLALQLVNAPLVGPPEPRPILAAPELLGPLGALNAARGARGEAAYKSLEGDPSLFAGARAEDAPPFARFALDCELRPDSVTLTWTLSAERRAYMRQRAEEGALGQLDPRRRRPPAGMARPAEWQTCSRRLRPRRLPKSQRHGSGCRSRPRRRYRHNALIAGRSTNPALEGRRLRRRGRAGGP